MHGHLCLDILLSTTIYKLVWIQIKVLWCTPQYFRCKNWMSDVHTLIWNVQLNPKTTTDKLVKGTKACSSQGVNLWLPGTGQHLCGPRLIIYHTTACTNACGNSCFFFFGNCSLAGTELVVFFLGLVAWILPLYQRQICTEKEAIKDGHFSVTSALQFNSKSPQCLNYRLTKIIYGLF